MTGTPLPTVTPNTNHNKSRDEAIGQAADAYRAALERRKGRTT